MDKDDAQRIHFARRLFERYGLEVDEKEYADARRSIQNGTAQFIMKQSNRVSVFAVVIKGVTVPVVYDKKRWTLVTALPREGYLTADGKVLR